MTELNRKWQLHQWSSSPWWNKDFAIRNYVKFIYSMNPKTMMFSFLMFLMCHQNKTERLRETFFLSFCAKATAHTKRGWKCGDRGWDCSRLGMDVQLMWWHFPHLKLFAATFIFMWNIIFSCTSRYLIPWSCSREYIGQRMV